MPISIRVRTAPVLLRSCVLWTCVFVAGSSTAHEDHPRPAPTPGPDEAPGRFYDTVEVRERRDDLVGLAGASSEGTTGREDLERRPIQRSGEIIETVPGAIATQHSGGGKANQYFLRGFNLDHGTDFSVFVDGMPVNMPTHGHGQGYADLNFVIPELIERVRFRKGPYRADVGDFSSAGGADIDYARSLPTGVLKVTGGSFDFGRVVVADSAAVADGDLTYGIEAFHDDGPWTRDDDYRRFNGVVGYHGGSAERGWSLTAMGSDGEWLSTDQIPRRAVAEGLIGRYDLIDPGPRGSTARYSLSGGIHRGGDTTWTRVSAFAIRYEFDLISNFTYFLDDPVNGDQFEQVDERWIGGLDAVHRWSSELMGTSWQNAVGLQLRYDAIENGLYRTVDLERVFTTREDSVDLLGGGVWADTWVRLAPRVRLNLGLRLDRYDATVEAFRPENSGAADDWMLNPKMSLAWRVADATELYLSAGSGFHSNDARGATIRIDPVTGEPVAPVDPLVRAKGVDLGVRTTSGGAYHGTVTAYWLELDSELLFVGDGGTTEASRPSRRVGLEWTNVWQANRWLAVDLDVTWTDAEFTDDDPAGSEIPGAIESTVAAGLTLTGFPRWHAGLRLRWFSGGPLVEDGSVEWGPTALLNARVAYDLTDRVRIVVEGFNLLDREDDDIAYYYASRLPGEPLEGIEDVHFHPVEKPAARVTVEWRF